MPAISLSASQALAASRLQHMETLAKQAQRLLEGGNINAAAIAVCKMERHLPLALQELAS